MRTAAVATLCLLSATSTLVHAAPTIIRGTVSGPAGVITGARVEAVDDRVAVAGTETGPDGHFTLILPDRPRHLIISAPGHVTRMLPPGHPGEEIAVALTAGGKTLSGRVIDLDGAPVSGGIVEVLTVVPRNWGMATGRPRTPEAPIYLRANHGVTALRAETERDGGFAIPGLLGNAKLTWRAWARGRVSAEQRVDWPPRYPVEVVLAPEAVIEGTVTAAGRPVAGVKVEASGVSGAEQVSDADGRFTLRRLPPGPTRLHIEPPPGLLAPELRPVLEPGEERTLEVVLAPPALVRGRVIRRDNGEPVANAVLTASVDGENRLFSARTDAEGRYELSLPAGRASVRYVGAGMARPFPGPWDQTAPRIEVAAQAGAVTEAPALPVEVWMTGDAVICGVVLGIDGQPCPGATVRLLGYPALPGREQSGMTTTDADGRFELRLEALRPALLMGLMARSLEGDVAVATFTREQTAPLTLRLQTPAWASAAVVDPEGRPLTMERVEINALMVLPDRVLLPLQPETRCAAGRVTVGPLPAGVTLRFSLGPNTIDRSPSTGGWDAPIVYTEPDGRIELPEVVLNLAGQEVSGRVLDPQERPVAGALMTMYGLPGSTNFVETDGNGGFHLTGLRSWGSFVALVATPDGELCCARRLDPADPVPATIVLAPPAAVEGQLLDAEGRPCPGVEVRVTGRWNRWDRDNLRTLPELDLRGSGSTVTDAAGRWRVEGLVPGVEASVEAWDRISNMRASASIEMLEPGMNPPVKLQLQPAAEPEPPGEPAPDD